MLVELLPSFSLHDTVATTPTTDKSKVTTDNPFIQIEILHTEKRKSTFFNEYQESYEIIYNVKRCFRYKMLF